MLISVFCSSSNDIADEYKKSAFELGQELIKKGHTLVYGGATGGLMDAVAAGAKAENGEIIGIIPKAILANGRLSKLPTELIETDNMSSRKEKMLSISDAFVVLPGSYGTLDEMFAVVASGIVGEHNKPLVCFNQNHFYDFLIQHLEKSQLMCKTSGRNNYEVKFSSSLEETLKLIEGINRN